jgi:hypothetical protein
MSCLLQKSEFAVLVAKFREVGVGTWQLWEDNQKTPIVAFIVYGSYKTTGNFNMFLPLEDWRTSFW